MPATTASNYKSKNSKDVLLPSGATFVIRKIPKSIIFRVLELLDKVKEVKEDTDPKELTPEQLKVYDDLYNLLIPACVIEPTVAKIDAKAGPDELTMDDLLSEDTKALVDAIFRHSQATAQDEESRKNSPAQT